MKTQYRRLSLPTVLLAKQYKEFANRPWLPPAAERYVAAIEEELQWRGMKALLG